MAKNDIPKISDFPYLGLCYGFAKVWGRGRWIYYSQLVAWLGSSRVPAVDSRQTSEAAAPSTRTGAHHTLQSAPAATTRPATTSCSSWPPPAAPAVSRWKGAASSPQPRSQEAPCWGDHSDRWPPDHHQGFVSPCPLASGVALDPWTPGPLNSCAPGPEPRDNSHYTTGDQLQPAAAPGASYGSYYLKIIKGKRKINIIIWAVSKIALIFLLRVKGFSDEDLKKQMKRCSCLPPSHLCFHTIYNFNLNSEADFHLFTADAWLVKVENGSTTWSHPITQNSPPGNLRSEIPLLLVVLGSASCPPASYDSSTSGGERKQFKFCCVWRLLCIFITQL